jgi:hypothetical protein
MDRKFGLCMALGLVIGAVFGVAFGEPIGNSVWGIVLGASGVILWDGSSLLPSVQRAERSARRAASNEPKIV